MRAGLDHDIPLHTYLATDEDLVNLKVGSPFAAAVLVSMGISLVASYGLS